jgi:hypothetical protein
LVPDSVSVADPESGTGAFLTPSGIWCLFDPVRGILDGLKIRIQIRDEHPDHIFESFEPIFWVKILKIFDADPGWKKFGSGIRVDKIRIRDPA